MKKEDTAAATADVLAKLDPDKVSKGLVAPLIMALLSVLAVKTNLRRLTGVRVTFARAYGLVTLVSWLSYVAGRGYTGGRLQAIQSHQATKDGLTR